VSEWDGPDMRETGVDTPGCDCGHDGMAFGWHLQGCHWREAMAAQERWEQDRWAQLTEAQRGLVEVWRTTMDRMLRRWRR
jgi:hypothetical protein